jgi:hypothetical protein
VYGSNHHEPCGIQRTYKKIPSLIMMVIWERRQIGAGGGSKGREWS